MSNIPDKIPDAFRVGDTVKFTHAHAQYSPEDWDLTVVLVKADKHHSIEATDNGTGAWLITLTAVESAKLSAGIYAYVFQVSDGTDRYTISEGKIEALENVAIKTGGHDARSYPVQLLAAIEACLLRRASSDQESYTFEGRSLKRLSHAELMTARETAKKWVAQEDRAARIARGEGVKTKVRARFREWS